MVAAIGLLSGCLATDPRGAPVVTPSAPAPSSGAARPSASQVAPTRDASPRRERLALLPPGCSPGQLRLASATPDGGGGEEYQAWSIRLVSGRPCTVWGAPHLRFLDPGGSALPFSTTRRWRGEHEGPVLVGAGHAPAFAVAKYRCDTATNSPTVASVVATLPLGAGTLTGTVPPDAARLAFCPRDGGDQRVHVGTIGTWQTSGPPPPGRVALSMHSAFASSGLPTWGRSDLDGDGHRDTVVVHPTGLVVATVGGHTTRIRVPGRPTDRLQGFTDLTGDGHPDVLVAVTALGCVAGYRFCASSPVVLTLRGGRFRTVHFPGAGVSWDDGQGDLFAGVVCASGVPVQVQVLMTGRHGYRLIRTTYRVTGLRARAVARSTVTGAGTPHQLAALATTRCPGLGRTGWAPEHGPAG